MYYIDDYGNELYYDENYPEINYPEVTYQERNQHQNPYGRGNNPFDDYRGHGRGHMNNFPGQDGFPEFNPGMIQGGQLPPPPGNAPAKPNAALFRVDPRSIRNCLYKFTYVWLDNGNEFWMYPIQVGRDSVSGFRWNRRFGWTYFGVSLDRVDSFMCV